MDSKLLLGIIAITILGTLSTHSIFVQAGISPIDTMQVTGPTVRPDAGEFDTSIAECPLSHPFLIGGTFYADGAGANEISPTFNTATNSFEVFVFNTGIVSTGVRAIALCATFNFPMNMGMIGGELLDINSVSLLIASIGVNPVITGLVGITIAGVAGQTAWFVHRRKKNLQKKI